MDCSTTLTVLLISTAVCLCRGVVLVGEDKRQGLIPFPRVGRTFNQWLPSAASLLRSELDELQDNVAYTPDDDLYALRYARGGLYVPREGRRKRSAAADMMADEANGGSSADTARQFGVVGQRQMAHLDDILRAKQWPAFANRNGMDKHMLVIPSAVTSHRAGAKQPNQDKMGLAKKLASSRFSRSSYFYDDDDSYNGDVDEASSNRNEYSGGSRSGQKQLQHSRLAQFAPRFDHSDTRER